jgi:predicted RND superfamily exporter protein
MNSLRAWITAHLDRGEQWLFANPKTILAAIFIVTCTFATQLHSLKIYTDFNDLLPQNHPYVQAYNRLKENFGGANQIVMVIAVDKGTIFTDQTLELIHRATLGIDDVPYVNHNLVSSLTHRSVRKVYLSPDGNVISTLYYDPNKPQHTAEQLAQLRDDVIADPQVYGLLVSPDLKAALIRAPMNETPIDYRAVINSVQKIQSAVVRPGYRVYLTGNPILTGYVYTYLHQILSIMAGTLALLTTLLVVYFRRFYGVFLPLLGIFLSSIWGLGFMAVCGFNLEPLSMPIPFLIAARAMSHGVQLVARYYEELAVTKNGKRAARNALDALFRPGSLAIIVDACGIAALVVGTAPFNHKLGISAGFWALSVIFTVHFMVPLALTVLPQPKTARNKNQAVRSLLAAFMTRTGGSRRGAISILGMALVSIVAGATMIDRVHIGEFEAGSPLLKRSHTYNQSTQAINGLFPGSDELHVLVRTADREGIKRPEVMHALETFQADMMFDPGAGGSKALPLVIRQVNRLTHNGDPRWAQLPDNAGEIGGLMFTYAAASPIPNALKEFVSSNGDEADVVFYYKDHRVSTVNRAIAVARASISSIMARHLGLVIEPGGGIIGLTAAVNESLHRDHRIIIPFVMVVAFLLVTAYYQSIHAGWLMVVPMLFSTLMTYAFMGWRGIAISANTVPVIAVGVGVGIDYSVYFMDRIREEMSKVRDVRLAAINAVSTTGYAVSFTALTLVAGVVLWIFMSDLRFQSDAALLLSYMLIVNAVAAMLIVPAWCVTFDPRLLTAHNFALSLGPQELQRPPARDGEALHVPHDMNRRLIDKETVKGRHDGYTQKVRAES